MFVKQYDRKNLLMKTMLRENYMNKENNMAVKVLAIRSLDHTANRYNTFRNQWKKRLNEYHLPSHCNCSGWKTHSEWNWPRNSKHWSQQIVRDTSGFPRMVICCSRIVMKSGCIKENDLFFLICALSIWWNWQVILLETFAIARNKRTKKALTFS